LYRFGTKRKILVFFIVAAVCLSAEAPAGGQAADNDPARIYRGALAQFYAGKYQEAREQFEKLIVDFSDSIQARDAIYKTGESFFREENWEKAGSYFRLYIDRFPLSRNAGDAQARLAQCEGKTGSKIAAVKILIRRKPIRHLAVRADFLTAASEAELTRAVADIAKSGATTIIVKGAATGGEPLHALFRDSSVKQGVYFQTEKAPVVGDAVTAVNRVAHGMGLRVLVEMPMLSAPWALTQSPEWADGNWDGESAAVKPSPRLDAFNEDAQYYLRGLLEDLAGTPSDGILLSDLALRPEEGLSEKALAAYRNASGASANPADFFGAAAREGGARTVELREPYAPYAEFKAKRLSEIAGYMASSIKSTNPAMQVFIEVDGSALTSAPEALAHLSQDAALFMRAGHDGLVVFADWRKLSPLATPDKRTEILKKLSQEAAGLGRDPNRVIICLNVEDAATKKYYPDWEIALALENAAGAMPFGVALFPMRPDFPYNRFFETLRATKKQKGI
jgi:tetratricopeptide (TPR) repeat protein